MKVRRLRILAGPNGSGKSSVYSKLKQTKDFHWGIFVNADEMEKLFRENGGLDVRQYGVDDFPWEVFKREYQPFYVATSSPDINIGRVAARVRNGGHNVPANKIRSRYVRSLNNLRDAVRLSDRAYIFDNSTSAYKWIAEYDARTGDLALRADEVPTWVVRYLLQ